MGRHARSLGHGRHFLVLGTDAVVLILAILDLFDFFFGGFASEHQNDILVIGRGMFVFVALLLYSILRISQSKRKGNFALYVVCLLYIVFHAMYPDSDGMSLRQLNLTVIIFSWTGFRASLQLVMCFVFVSVSLIVSADTYIMVHNCVVSMLYFGFGILSWQLQLYLAEEFCWCRKDISLALRHLPDQFFACDERRALSFLSPVMAWKELTIEEALCIFMRFVQLPTLRDIMLGVINEEPLDNTGAVSGECAIRVDRRSKGGPEGLNKGQTIFDQQQSYRRQRTSSVRMIKRDDFTLNGVRLNSIEQSRFADRLSERYVPKRKEMLALWLQSIDSVGNRLSSVKQSSRTGKGPGGRASDTKVLRKERTSIAAVRHSVTNVNLNRVKRRSATTYSPTKFQLKSPVSSVQNINSGDEDEWCTPKIGVTRTNSSVQSSREFCNLTSNLDHDSKVGAYGLAVTPQQRASRRVGFSISALPHSSSEMEPSGQPTCATATSIIDTTNRTRRSGTVRGTLQSFSTMGPVKRRSEVHTNLDTETETWRRPSLLSCVRRSDSIHNYMLAPKTKLAYPGPGSTDRVYLSPYKGLLETAPPNVSLRNRGRKKKKFRKRRKQDFEYKRRAKRRKPRPPTTIRFQDSAISDDPPLHHHLPWRDGKASEGDDYSTATPTGAAGENSASGGTATTAQSSEEKYIPKPIRKSYAGEENYNNRSEGKRLSFHSVGSRRRRSRKLPSAVATAGRPSTARTRTTVRWQSTSRSTTDDDDVRSDYCSSSSVSSAPESQYSSSTSTSFGSGDTPKKKQKTVKPQKTAEQKCVPKPSMRNGSSSQSVVSCVRRFFDLLRLRLAILESVIQEGSSDVRAHLPRGNAFGTFSDRKIERWYLAWSSVVQARIFCSMWPTLVAVVGLMFPLTLGIMLIVSYLRIPNPQVSVSKFSMYVSIRCIVHCALLFGVTFPQRRARFRGSVNSHHFVIRGTVTALLINLFSASDYTVAILCGDTPINSVKYIYLPMGSISLMSLASPTTYSVLYWSIALAAFISFSFVAESLAISFLSNVIQFYILHYFFITRPFSEIMRRLFCRFVLPYVLLCDCLLPLKSQKLLMESGYSSAYSDSLSHDDRDSSSEYSYSSNRYWRCSSLSTSLSSSR